MKCSDQDRDYLKNLTVLYVEDDEPARSFLERILLPRVGRIVTAHDGVHGLELFRSIHPDIVITDIHMPLMDGLAMAQEIREQDANVPIIVITAFEQTDYLMRSIDIGVDRYVTKPVLLDRLMKALMYCAHQILTEERLRYLALHDPLTELPNRTLLQDRLVMACAAADRNEEQVAMLFIDLDRFKSINDSYGHIAGDRVLQEVARRLKSLFRSVDTVCRMSGDEFLVVMTGVSNREGVASAARKMVEALHVEMTVEGHVLSLSASVGIAMYPQDGSEMESLIRSSDSAMYHSKQQGGNRFSFLPPATADAS